MGCCAAPDLHQHLRRLRRRTGRTYQRFHTFEKVHPNHPETRMLLELNIAAEDFSPARRAITELVAKDPTARSLTIMAAIERGEGSADAVVRGWLAKAPLPRAAHSGRRQLPTYPSSLGTANLR
jgi:uncharacterized membrane-anchored protein